MSAQPPLPRPHRDDEQALTPVLDLQLTAKAKAHATGAFISDDLRPGDHRVKQSPPALPDGPDDVLFAYPEQERLQLRSLTQLDLLHQTSTYPENDEARVRRDEAKVGFCYGSVSSRAAGKDTAGKAASARRHAPSPKSALALLITLATLTAAALALCAPTASALSPCQTCSAWWHMSAGARPHYLRAGARKPAIPGVNEKQKVTVSGLSGETWSLADMSKAEVEKEEFECESGPKYAVFTVGASGAEVQKGLEGACGYGPGSVEVTASPASEPTEYEVTFKGPFAEQPVRLMNTEVTALLGSPVLESVTEVVQSKAGIPAAPDGELYVTAENLGDAPVQGGEEKVTFTDVLPKGLHAVGVEASEPFAEGDFARREAIPCTLQEANETQTASCTMGKPLAPYDQLEMRIAVNVQPGAESSPQENKASISGGKTPAALTEREIAISNAPVPFGVDVYEMSLEEAGGEATTQAGAHPFQMTTTIDFDQLRELKPLSVPEPEVLTPALAKDLNVKLPPGLIGNTPKIPQCSTAQFFRAVEDGRENTCPAESAVGVATLTVQEPATVRTATITEPVFNLEPRQGEPARFGINVVIANTPVFIDTSVGTGADYAVTAKVSNITQLSSVLSSEVTLWGVPNDPRHDNQRGWGCIYEARGAGAGFAPCVPSEQEFPTPFLSLPTRCEPALKTSLSIDSWQDPGNFSEVEGRFLPKSPLEGCNRLQFGPEVKVIPDAPQTSRPSGLDVDVHVPQEASSATQGLTSSDIKDISVKLPEGLSVNPSSADGLQACSEGEVGFLAGEQGEEGELLFTPTLPEAFCPDAAKIGTVTIKSPLLPAGQYVQGALYLATPAPNGEAAKNPFNSLLALYIIAKDPISGVLVKLPGSATLDSASGQITTTFANNPQLAFEDAEVHLFGGERAPLAMPALCGSYTTQATFTPWSGGPPVNSSSSFQIASGPNGAPCPPSPLPFTPQLNAGTQATNGGSFSPFITSINREDGNQQLSTVSVHTPPGLSGVLSGVTLCPQANAEVGSCPANSLIGKSTVTAGFGADPFTVNEGKVFLTESYEGAPFGLSILTPAIAGPFNLGNVIVRAKIEVDPHTAQLTVSTDQSGPHAIPHILDGIPLDIRHVNVTIDRQSFTFNPTNCAPQSITATITGLQGALAQPQAPFQATNCQSLKFAPKFSVSVSSKATKANGTSFNVKLAYPSAPLGAYANLAKAKVSLPKQLPSRLSTLNKACTAATFEANPEACPKESRVGSAKVSTPLLPVPLTGSAFFVSHAAEAFPDLTIVLKGYGITIDLVGNTQIKKGITTTTFKATPDVPFSVFELSLPAQKYSALTANTNLCTAGKLQMPTEFTAQNGALLRQSTPVQITGCPKLSKLAKALKSCQKKHNKAKRRACEAAARRRFGGRKGGSGARRG